MTSWCPSFICDHGRMPHLADSPWVTVGSSHSTISVWNLKRGDNENQGVVNVYCELWSDGSAKTSYWLLDRR